MTVTHRAAGDAARAGGGVEHVVDPVAEPPVVAEHGSRIRADTPEIVVGCVELGGERAGVDAPARRQHRKAAHAAGAEAVKVRLPVAVEPLGRAGAGVEQDLVALEEASRVGRRPRLEAPGVLPGGSPPLLQLPP